MKKFELKIHPPVVALIAAAISWLSTQMLPYLKFEIMNRWILIIFLLASAGILGLTGIKQFRDALTTIHPHKPEQTQKLITDGLYKYTRNPMYLGLLFGLLACVVWLGSPVALLGPLFFIVYITRFQIQPEERILKEKFGENYEEYLKKVRRWL